MKKWTHGKLNAERKNNKPSKLKVRRKRTTERHLPLRGTYFLVRIKP
jgi:hypothetical protein